MEELFIDLLESAKKDRKLLCKLKNTAVACQKYELATKIREIELQLFPDTEEMKEAKSKALNLNTALRMVELNIEHDLCWLINETLKMFAEKGGQFSIDDATTLMFKKKELFFKAE